jgi:hypothetical protein
MCGFGSKLPAAQLLHPAPLVDTRKFPLSEEKAMAVKHKKISRIRTGGQTGVDRAAMDFAREYGIPLCGWCPKNGWAEDYPGLLSDYPELTETPSKGTEQRTKWNMRDADAILTIIPVDSSYSPGTDVGLSAGEQIERNLREKSLKKMWNHPYALSCNRCLSHV